MGFAVMADKLRQTGGDVGGAIQAFGGPGTYGPRQMGDINNSFLTEMLDPKTNKMMELTAGAGQAGMTDAMNTYSTAAIIMPAFNAAVSRAVVNMQDLNIQLDRLLKQDRIDELTRMRMQGPMQ